MDLRGLNTALLVIDMQNGFCHPQGSHARLGNDAAALATAIPGCRRLIEAAHASKIPVIYTRAVYETDFADVPLKVRESERFEALLSAGFVMKGTWDADVVDELRPASGDHVIDKNRYSAFVSSGIPALLSGMQVRNLVVCGVVTSVCVESTARDASQRDYRVFVVSDATADGDPDNHAATLRVIDRIFGWVVDTSQVIEAFDALSEPSPTHSRA